MILVLLLTLLTAPAAAIDSHDMQGAKTLSEGLIGSMANREGSYITQFLPNDWAIATVSNSGGMVTASRTLFNTESKHIYSISYTCTMTEQVGLVEMMDASIRTGDIGEPKDVLFRFMRSNKEMYIAETRSVKERWYTPRNPKGAISSMQKADQLVLVFVAENKEYKTITISLTGSSKAIETAKKQCL